MFHSWDFLWDTYGFVLLVSDLSPNIGLFWYYFTEIFKHFQKFYVFSFQYHVFLYAIPLYLRLGFVFFFSIVLSV
jgi:phosphatidylinositol glycan class U